MFEKREKVRVLISKYCLSYVWLINQLSKKGIDIGPNELCQYVTGRRRGPKAEKMLDACIDVLEEYGKIFECERLGHEGI